MKRIAALLGLLSLVSPVPSFGQGLGMSEVIVTARRNEAQDYSSNMPAVGLQRTADSSYKKSPYPEILATRTSARPKFTI